MAGIEKNEGQLRTALILVYGKLYQGDGTYIPVTVDVLAQMMDISYGNATAIMPRLAKDGIVELTRGRFHPTESAYDHDLGGAQ